MRREAPSEAMAVTTPPRELFAYEDFLPEQPSTGRTAFEWIVVVAGAVIVALIMKTFVVQAFFIPSGSMEPTLQGGQGIPGDRVLVDKISYRLHAVNRADIIVFHAPPDFPAPDVQDLIKRVIGLPGDSVTFANGKVRINGRPLNEPYLPATTQTLAPMEGAGQYTHQCTDTDPCVVPAGHLWVMGDNRTNSEDSRYIGPIDQDLVVGRALVLVWPFSRMSGL
jgi:signal peptidase I